MKSGITILVLLLSSLCVAAQDSLWLAPVYERMRLTGDSMLNSRDEVIRRNAAEEFSRLCDSLLNLPESPQFSFYTVSSLSIQVSPDQSFRILNWMNLPQANSPAYTFYGYLQRLPNRKQKASLHRLEAGVYPDNEKSQTLKLGAGQWYPCIYYQIIQRKFKGKAQYLALGWAPQAGATTRKVIEPIVFIADSLQLGAPVIKKGGKKLHRLIFEYNAQAVMSLREDEKDGRIYFDHLSPSDPRPEAKGMWSLYGPDMTYDALRYKKGIWEYQKGVEPRNDSRNEGKNPKLEKQLRPAQNH